MRGIIRFSLNNKFAIWILTFIITFAGLYAGVNMKQETLPNLEVPYVQVTTIYPGATPEEIVETVTQPLEQRLQNLSGVVNVMSSSLENASSITVEFNFGQDMDEATQDIREATQGLNLPTGVNDPSIMQISLSQIPVLAVSLSDESMTLEELTKRVETEVQPSLEGVEGVSSAMVTGQYYDEVQLRFDEEKMASLGLDENTVKGVVQGSSLRAPLGLFEMEGAEKSVVVDGNIIDLDDLKQLAIPVVPSGAGAPQGAPGAEQGTPTDGAQAGGAVEAPAAGGFTIPTVQLQEIAAIEVVGKTESISRTNGQESIGIQIVKAPDANTVEVVNAVKEELEAFQDRYDSLSFVTMLDQGKPIEESVATMLSKALFGAIFAVIVIMLFLRNIRTTLISIISIPLSLLIGVLLLKQMDITLNMMTLGAMTVAIGRVVDDSIVVIENIYRRMSLKGEKLKGKELILSATREMFIPISSSTIVTIAVFLPLGTVSGMVGQLFLPFALTIVFALLASLLVSVTIVPMLGHMMFRNGVSDSKKHTEEAPGRLSLGYKRVLSWSLNHKWITSILAILVLVGSLFLVPLIGVSFLPEEEDKYAIITYSPEPGELLSDVEAKALSVESFILDQPDVTDLQYSVGGQSPMGQGPSNSALFYVMFDSETESFEDVKRELVEDLRETAAPGGTWNQMDMGMGGVGGNTLSLTVYGDTIEEIQTVVDQIAELMRADANFEKVETSLSETYGQYTLVADQEKLSGLGLTAGQIAMALAPQRERPVLTDVSIEGKNYKVYIEADTEQFTSIEDIENKTIQSPLGIPVQLKDVVTVEEGESPNSISRKNGKLYADVSGDILVDDVAKATADLQAKVDKLEVPPTVDIETGGVSAQINETFTQLGLAMAAAVAIVYLVLVITFGGALAPFAILLSLPFAIIGALVALLITGETISVSAMMGALMLIGIVVTNAIVLLDRVIQKEKEGMSTREALLEAAVTRLRPILMTALATIGALLPLAFGFENAGIISKGLGVTVIGGLASSTLLTLLIVPIAYEALMRFRKKRPEEILN